MPIETSITVAKQEIVRGTDVTLSIAILDSVGNAKSLAGVTEIVWAMSREYTDVTPTLMKKLSLSEIVITDSGDGLIDIAIKDTDTSLFDLGQYVHEIVTTDGASLKTPVLRGKVELIPSLAA